MGLFLRAVITYIWGCFSAPSAVLELLECSPCVCTGEKYRSPHHPCSIKSPGVSETTWLMDQRITEKIKT